MRQKIINNIKNNLLLYRLALFMGLTGYGGMAVIQEIKKQYVNNHNIVDEKRFIHSLGFAQILPGSTIISLVAYFSYLKAGLIGATISTFLYVFPAFVISTAISAFYFRYGKVPYVNEIVGNLNVLLMALLTAAFIGIGRTIFTRDKRLDYRGMLITLISGALYFFTSLPIVAVIFISGILGIVFYFFTGYFNGTMTKSELKTGKLFLRKKAWIIFLLFIILFAASVFYFSEPLWKLFFSFLKIGSLAFGGGIAAIPLMENSLVHKNGWFTISEFWDGMSVSQMTPGPILISAAFFGYRIAGIVGAFVSTVAICIPSFLLVIIFGKIYDRIKHLGVVRGTFRGFLAGFLGILAILVVSQIPRLITGWEPILLFAVTFLLIIKSQRGLVPALLATVVFSILSRVF